jgi:hypothetical protein
MLTQTFVSAYALPSPKYRPQELDSRVLSTAAQEIKSGQYVCKATTMRGNVQKNGNINW